MMGLGERIRYSLSCDLIGPDWRLDQWTFGQKTKEDSRIGQEERNEKSTREIEVKQFRRQIMSLTRMVILHE